MPGQSSVPDDQVALVRRFNRTYTKQLGLLQEGLLKSDFTLTEARVLYELANREDLTATVLRRDLGLDAGYLSRILKAFGERGYLSRTPAGHDARQSILSLTAEGRAAFEPLNQASHDEIAALLARFGPGERGRLTGAMETLDGLLGNGATDPHLSLRPHRPGDMGWIVHRQAVLYHEEYGWDDTFEALDAEIAASFINNFDAARERCWIAELDGRIAGSVFIVRNSDTVAKLRLLYVEAWARGHGIGSRLVDEAIAFARAAGYATLTFRTNDVLVSARRIYQAAGFELVSEESHRSFGKDLVGQYWRMEL
ncbi:MAG TPA: helix-turn-helix domain-containing GNAT family N-acetyltransferase [Afifellaceae bacterium]|nr:helix-turn-helix domain-containing GNAT family N-acetyltransferase [Afifellaceae bacterium]